LKQKNFYEEDDYIKNLEDKLKTDELGGEIDPYYSKKAKRINSIEKSQEKPHLKVTIPIKEKKFLEDDVKQKSRKDILEIDPQPKIHNPI